MAAAAPLVSRIDNIHLYVRHMATSLVFYRDVLGIPLTGDELWAEADLGGVRFALHPLSPSVDEISSGSVAINFEVADADDAARQVRDAGFEARETMREEYGVSYEVVDPDGYRIYLFQPPAR